MIRRGFTLVELLVVIAVGGILAAGITAVLNRQQRFYGNAGSLVTQRTALRDATGILPGELRALAPGAGDILAFSDSALEIRATIGTAVACDTVAGGGSIHLAPDRSGDPMLATTLAAFTASPDDGDVALIYDEGAGDTASDSRWSSVRLAGFSSATGLCAMSSLGHAIDSAAASMRLRVTTGERVPPTVRPGAFVRVVRRVRYRFYRAGNGEWFLGYSEWQGTGYGVVQPVSGPFAPYRVNGRGGIAFRYFDAAGAELTSGTDPTRIARVAIAARGAAGHRLSQPGAVATDSQTVAIRLRNQ